MAGCPFTDHFNIRYPLFDAYYHHPHVQQMKKLIVLGIAIGCIVLMYHFPHAMLNPGELVDGHQKLNENCLACHNPFWGISNEKCITCHKLADIGKDSL